MMKLILAIVLAVSLVAVTALAEVMKRDESNQIVQGSAWHGGKSLKTTAASTTIDMRADLAYSIYCTVDAYERWMPSATSTKADYVQTIIPSGGWVGAVVNPATPFLNLSGCTAGFIKRH